MMKPTTNLVRLGTLAALIIAVLSLPANALDFTIRSLNCSQLTWTLAISENEWDVASNVELFFASTQGARNYSLLYSATRLGDFPTPGTYNLVTPFGSTILSGSYQLGVGLTDVQGAILSASSASVQTTDVDPRVFTFDECSSSLSGTVTASTPVVSSSSSTSGTTATGSSSVGVAPSLATSAVTSATVTRTAPTSPVITSSVPASSTPSTSAVAASTLSPATNSTVTHSNMMSKGAIAGAVIGGLVFLVILFALVRWCTSRQRTRKLSRGDLRPSPLRPLTLTEKLDGDAPVTPLSPNRFSSRFHASGDSLGAGPLGRYSPSSARKSEAFTDGRRSVSSVRKSDGFSTRAPSRLDTYSLNNVYIPGESEGGENEIKVDNVPFHLFPAPPGGPTRDTGATSTPHSPYLSLNRTVSTPEEIPTYPSIEQDSHGRSRSIPLPLQLPSINTSPLTSPTRSMRPSPSTASFKIPRVTVPSYTEGEEPDVAVPRVSIDAGPSRASSTKRFSIGAATFASADEDPFVDAFQEMPGNRQRTLL